jgi:hypothetical protein
MPEPTAPQTPAVPREYRFTSPSRSRLRPDTGPEAESYENEKKGLTPNEAFFQFLGKETMSNTTLTPPGLRRQSPNITDDLLACDVRAYLREVAFIASEAATTSNPEVVKLGLRLLARQARRLDALIGSCQ